MCIICDGKISNDIIELNINDCQEVKEIPNLSNLKELYSSNTHIAKIPLLPNLERLSCDNTHVLEIPFLPNLKWLYCNNTQIKELPLLPNLEYLYCDNTQLVELPLFPKLKWLYCFHTPIVEIPLFPNIQILWCYSKYFYDHNKFLIGITDRAYTIIRKLQHNYRVKRNLRKYFASRAYVEWWYHPDRQGGKKSKKDISQMLDDL